MALRILIVDDSPAMRSVIRRTLRMSGMQVVSLLEASNGEGALNILHSEPVDLVLTDINMPGMDGEELMRRLAADAALCTIPVIAISTDATESRLARMRALGVDGYVTKPFTPAVLRAELERALGLFHE